MENRKSKRNGFYIKIQALVINNLTHQRQRQCMCFHLAQLKRLKYISHSDKEVQLALEMT